MQAVSSAEVTLQLAPAARALVTEVTARLPIAEGTLLTVLAGLQAQEAELSSGTHQALALMIPHLGELFNLAQRVQVSSDRC